MLPLLVVCTWVDLLSLITTVKRGIGAEGYFNFLTNHHSYTIGYNAQWMIFITFRKSIDMIMLVLVAVFNKIH